MKVIGITGESPVNGIHAGKDTAGNFLREYLEEQGLTVRMQAWADKLKVMAARSLGIEGPDESLVAWCDWLKVHGRVSVSTATDHEYTGDGVNGFIKKTITGREFLEFMGTEGGRDVLGMNVWVDAALPPPGDFGLSATWRAQHGFPNVVIDTTTRFPNELTRIREWNGKIIRIERPGVENPPGQHVSKYGIPAEECDAIIQNDGDLDLLQERVIEAFNSLETMPV